MDLWALEATGMKRKSKRIQKTQLQNPYCDCQTLKSLSQPFSTASPARMLSADIAMRLMAGPKSRAAERKT
jgi:hypothetical protein